MSRVIERQGGIFAAVPGKLTRPAYSYGPAGKGAVRDVMFQCPVSAIPPVVFELLATWYECRTMGALPFAGGWMDQPKMVRTSFPVFETEMRKVEGRRQEAGQQAVAAAAVAGVVAAGKRR